MDAEGEMSVKAVAPGALAGVTQMSVKVLIDQRGLQSATGHQQGG